MKKMAFCILAFSVLAFGQSNLLIKGGGVRSLDLNATGILGGIEYGYNFDEMVNISLGTMVQKTGDREVTRSDPIMINGSPTYRKIITDESHWVFPIKAGLRIRLPLGASVLPVISGGAGYVLYNYSPSNTKDSTTNADATLLTEGLYRGFYWEGGLGFDWKLGSRSSLVGDVVYQGAEPTNKNDYAKNLKAIQFHVGLLLEF